MKVEIIPEIVAACSGDNLVDSDSRRRDLFHGNWRGQAVDLC